MAFIDRLFGPSSWLKTAIYSGLCGILVLMLAAPSAFDSSETSNKWVLIIIGYPIQLFLRKKYAEWRIKQIGEIEFKVNSEGL